LAVPGGPFGDETRTAATLADLAAGRLPDANGRYGPFGGRFVPETLMPAVTRLEREARAALEDRGFRTVLERHLRYWVGRPTPLTEASRLGERWGVTVLLKREDLAHTGAHSINNALGQALLACRLAAKRVVVATGSGQHGVAAAASSAKLGLPCTAYIGEIDARRQAPNVDRMARFGAGVVRVKSGDRTLRAAMDEALRDWASDPQETYFMPGSAVGPHPFPWLVRELQSVIGREAREQVRERCGRLPDAVMACVGGGSNAIGLFHAFLRDEVALLGFEAGGSGPGAGQHAAALRHGTPGVLHGSFSLLLQHPTGQVRETRSVAAGLDYPGVGPEHAFLQIVERARYDTVSDTEALLAATECCEAEGILPALETAHAFAGARRWALDHDGATILIGLSGRGDKDLPVPLPDRAQTRAGPG
jgi:tryptophan synthase beta chain